MQIARAEIETLTTEISRLRDSLVRMETEKSNAQREASGHRLDSDQLRAQLDDLELELEQLKDELEQERATNRGLQTTLQSSRQKEQNAVLEIQVSFCSILFFVCSTLSAIMLAVKAAVGPGNRMILIYSSFFWEQNRGKSVYPKFSPAG